MTACVTNCQVMSIAYENSGIRAQNNRPSACPGASYPENHSPAASVRARQPLSAKGQHQKVVSHEARTPSCCAENSGRCLSA